ncbi:hypothetical protein [Bradyrhizobium diazoefficiens]|nr:hypothetical protein [Bradyrhizobium diazoefficiens]WLA66540.1 hypothetical protein QNN01_07080 [Bradyrhizobium diazoefficiens]
MRDLMRPQRLFRAVDADPPAAAKSQTMTAAAPRWTGSSVSFSRSGLLM